MDRVINPKTKKYIKIDGPTYNKLLDEGYTKSYLNSLHQKEDLELSMTTDKPIEYNDDVMITILRYLSLNELFAMNHTSKHISKLLNDLFLLNDLAINFKIEPVHSFNAFIHDIIYKKYKYDMSTLHDLNDVKPGSKNLSRQYSFNIISSFKLIYNAYRQEQYISSCKTRRTTDNPLCHAKIYLKDYGFNKEIDRLQASTPKDYKKNLNQLEYAIYYHLLSTI